MAKKTDKSVEKLRADVQALSEAVWALKKHVRVEVAATSADSDARSRKSRKLSRLAEQSAADGSRGLVSAFGTYRLSGPNGNERTVQWQLENAATESVIPDDLEAAATRLAAIGHRQRLAIIVTLLEHPSSVSDLVGSLDLGTSGAAYHHLNVLQGAGLVQQQERGTFEIVPDQVGTILGILSALAATPTVEDVVPNGEAGSES
jgi:DNA-binding transcriptional ArsR family regulator